MILFNHRMIAVIVVCLITADLTDGGTPTPSTLSASTPWPVLQWKSAAPSPFARVETPGTVVGGEIYLFGGSDSDLDASHELDVYDPARDAWSRRKQMPTGVTHLNAVVDGSTIWFAGGFKGKHPGPVTGEVWKYDTAADTWAAGFPLPEPRGSGGLAIADGRLHYFGGYKADRDTNSADHWSLALNGGKAWEREADLPVPRGHLAAAVVDGMIYALGGAHGHDITQIDQAACERYDPSTRKWTEIAPLPEGRSHFEWSTIVHNDRILIVGGRCNSGKPPRGVVNDMLEYDPKTDRWNVVGTIPEPVMAPVAAVIGDELIVTAGGLNNPRPLTAATHVAKLAD